MWRWLRRSPTASKKGPEAAGPRGLSVSWHDVGLGAVILIFLVQVWGLLFRPMFGDELPLVRNVLHFAEGRTIVPVQFSYPTLYSYVLAAWTALAAATSSLFTGNHPGDFAFGLLWSMGGSFEFGPELFALRGLSVVLGLGILLATYALGKAVGGPRVGLTAAVLMSASKTLADRAGYALPDVLLTFFTTLGCLLVVRSAARPDQARLPRRLVGAAALFGMAAATKYNGALALTSAFAARILRFPTWRAAWSERARLVVEVGVLGVVAVAAFLALTPAIGIVPRDYFDGFRYEAGHMIEGQPLVDLGEYPLLWIPMRLLMTERLLGAVFAAALVGCVALRRERAVQLLMVPLFLTVLAVSRWHYTSVHYLLWCFPILAVFAAALVWRLTLTSARPSAAALLVVALCVPNWTSLWEQSRAWRVSPSNQVAAERFIEANIPPGSRVEHDWYALPTIWNVAARGHHLQVVAKLGPRLRPQRLQTLEHKPIYVGSLGFVPSGPTADRLEREHPEWVITSSDIEPFTVDPLPGYNSEALRSEHRQLSAYYATLRLSSRYALSKTFDQGPGPVIRLYRRVDHP